MKRSLRAPRNQLSLALVAVILGFLVVVQLRAQGAETGLDVLSAQELTVLVANLNTQNDQLRAEIALTEAEVATLQGARSRGDSSVAQLGTDLSRVREWAGLDAVSGPGVRVTVAGPVSGPAVQDLLNELRNAGAEALAVGTVRVVDGSVVGGVSGGLTIEGSPLPDPFEVSAIGNAATLTGSLSRSGGIIAQLAATFPDAQLTVIPVDALELPATSRTLIPAHGTPKL